jgi:hypothetical protein
MRGPFALAALSLALCITFLFPVASLRAEEIPVRYREGRIHGFLVLRDVSDQILASGTLVQAANGNRVTSDLAFRFKDGSIYQETSVFSQTRTFRLLTYHLVYRGKAFKNAMDLTLSTSTGRVAIRHTDDDGKEQTINEQLKLPTDLANGMVPILLGDIRPNAPKTTVSMLVATPKPRLVKLEISPAGEDSFTVGGTAAKATRYVVKVEIGGISGVIAPLVGKQPPDTYMWMVEGKVPGFLKSEGPLVPEGPVWRIELASPVWPKADAEPKR